VIWESEHWFRLPEKVEIKRHEEIPSKLVSRLFLELLHVALFNAVHQFFTPEEIRTLPKNSSATS
jgi:hypothetical protein